MDIGTLTGQIAIEDQLSDGLTKATERVKAFVDEFDGMAGAVVIGAGVVAAAITGIAISIVALGEEGSKILGVENAFDILAEKAGTTGDALRGSLTEGLKGTVSEMTEMQSVMKLMQSGMQLTTEQAGLMGEASRELGKAAGGDAAAGLETLSAALQTGRVRGLQRQIGMIDMIAGEQQFADSIGVTVGQLSAAGILEGKRIAIMDATQAYLDRIGISELSFAEKIKQGKIAVEEWGASLAKSVASSPDVMEALDTIAAEISKAFGSNSQTLMDLILSGINAFARGVTAAVPYVVAFADGVRETWNVLVEMWPVIKLAGEAVLGYYAAMGLAVVAVETFTGLGAAYTATMALLAGEATTTSVVFDVATLSVNTFALAVGALAAGYALGTWLEQNTKWARELSDAFEYAALRVQGQTAAEADATIAQQHATEETIKADAAAKDWAASLITTVNGVRVLTDQENDNADALKNNSEYIKDNKQAIDTLVETWTNGGKAAAIITGAFNALTKEQLANSQTQELLIPELDKLVKAHQVLTPAMHEVYVAALASKSATTDLGIATLTTKGITLDYIDTAKRRGESEANIATVLGVTVEAEKKYEAQLRATRTFEAESLKTSTELWAAWAAEVEKSLATSAYDTARLAIQQWYDTQVATVDAWLKKELEASAGDVARTAAIKQEYAQRLSALEMTEHQKVVNLDASIALQDTSSKAYYDRQASLSLATLNTMKGHLGQYSDAMITAQTTEANALRMAADQWLPWSGAGQAANTSLIGAISSTTSAVQTLASTTQTSASTQVAAISSVTQSYYAQVDAAFAAIAAASGGTVASTGSRPGSAGTGVNEGSMEYGAGINTGVSPGTAPTSIYSGIKLPTINFGFASHASGGGVRANEPINVGELGPEVWVPPASGTIVPHQNSSGGPTPVVISVSGVLDPRTIRELAAAVGAEQMKNSGRKF